MSLHNAAGFLHVRNANSALIVLGVISILSALFPFISIGVSIKSGLPTRGVGTPELCALLVAIILPELTRPRFNNFERKSPTSRRFIHSLFTLLVVVSPCVPVLLWYFRLRWDKVGYELPPVIGLLGTPIMLCAASVLASLILGAVYSVCVPVVIFSIIVVTQHLFPAGLTADLFATGKQWHTCWPLVAFLVVLALVIDFKQGSSRRG